MSAPTPVRHIAIRGCQPCQRGEHQHCLRIYDHGNQPHTCRCTCNHQRPRISLRELR